MKKILLAIDATNLNINSLDFACFLGSLTKSKITGVFLENLVAEEKPVLKSLQGAAYIDWMVDENSDEHKAKMEAIKKNIAFFKEGCINRQTQYEVHREGGVPLSEVIEESRFADALIVDAETSFSKHFESIPTGFIKDVLKKVECPVILAPENFEAIDEIAFTYNGSSSSVFAIKQFTYLFPELKEKKVSIIQVNETGEWPDKDKNKFTEWLQNHYTNLHFKTLKGETENVLFDYLFKRKNMFLVMGAYGRNSLSQFFKHSHADLLINTITQPIFIAHI